MPVEVLLQQYLEFHYLVDQGQCVAVNEIVIGSIVFAEEEEAFGKLRGICSSVFMYNVLIMKNTSKKKTISIIGIIMMVGSFCMPTELRFIVDS